MRSIIITDPISQFKRDLIPFVLRINRTVKNPEDLGTVQIVNSQGLIDLTNRISRGEFEPQKRLRVVKDTVVYFMLGYREGLGLKFSKKAIMEAFNYCVGYFSNLNYGVRVVLPIIRSRRITKEQKSFFKELHIEIKTLTDEIDDLKILSCPLSGKDPTSPNGESVNAMAQTIGHEIVLRKIKDVVATDVKRPPKRSRVRSVDQRQKLKSSTDDRIIIVDEIPSKFKRGRKKQGV